MPEYNLVDADEALLKQFLSQLTLGVKSFRYFQTRPLSIIQNHLTTLLLTDNSNQPVAYGHLEQENGTLWLGVAVADDHTGLGLGKQMMKALIDTARKAEEPTVTLSVDKDNEVAQQLYYQFGFKEVKETDTIKVLKLELN